jgi:hypothetical protein
MNSTIIYYTSNREDPIFERKIQATLVANSGGVPIISVSQKPIDLGTNICVGDVGASGFNVCRQIQKACEKADTDFVITAEADCLYSPDYFQFRPERLDIPYRNRNIYVLKYKQDFFCKKDSSLFSQVVGREFFLERLERLFEGQPQWSTEFKNFPKEIHKALFDEFEYFESDNPCISFKTGRGMRKHSNSDEIPVYELPFWGTARELRKIYENN